MSFHFHRSDRISGGILCQQKPHRYPLHRSHGAKMGRKRHRTVTAAKQEAKIHSPAYYAVMRSFGITGRNLVPSETDYIEKWRSEYGFSIDIICAACQQTIQSIHQPSFPYTDKMLSNWRKLNVHTMEDVKRLNLEHKERTKASAQEAAGPKNKFTSIGQRSYEYDELEKMLLTTNSKH